MNFYVFRQPTNQQKDKFIMGSIISSPKPPAPIYITPPPAPTTQQDSAVKEAEESQESLRTRQVVAKQRGLSSNIATSDRGVLQTSSLVPPRKNLLGE
jgi:hypothetical protein